jgi:hypothetical protein
VASFACARSLGGFTDAPSPEGDTGIAAALDGGGPRDPDDARDGDASVDVAVEVGAIEAAAADAADGAQATDGADTADRAGAADGVAASVADGDDSQVNAAAPRPGDILITEVMFEPSGPEPLAEWFEVYNAAPVPERLDGLTIRDGYPHDQVVAGTPPVILFPQSYAVFVRDHAMAMSTFVPAASIAFDYGGGLPADEGVVLGDGPGGELSLWSGGTLVADLPYGPWSISGYGQSIELAVLRYEGSDQEWAWCPAPNPWGAGTDYGTPGAANDCP